jgi:hypothetical protein
LTTFDSKLRPRSRDDPEDAICGFSFFLGMGKTAGIVALGPGKLLLISSSFPVHTETSDVVLLAWF